MPGKVRKKGTAKNRDKGSRRERERRNAEKKNTEKRTVRPVRTSNYQGPRAEQQKKKNRSKKPEKIILQLKPNTKQQKKGGSREPEKFVLELAPDTGQQKNNSSGEPQKIILQQYLKPNAQRERQIQRQKKEIMESKARKELNRKASKETAATRVSYVRKPFARRSRLSFLLTAAALLLGGLGLYQGVATQGHASITYGAMGLCSIFLAVMAIFYGVFSFLERDKNYILSKLGIGISIVMLVGWAVVIIVGLGD